MKYIFALIAALSNFPEDTIYYNWSCVTPELIRELNDMSDNEDRGNYLVEIGECFWTEGVIVSPIIRVIETYQHKDGTFNMIIEVNGPGNRKHFIVVVQNRNII